MKIPKPQKTSSADLQIEALMKMLEVWPNCPSFVLDAYIMDKFETTVTEACLQEARKRLSLRQPEYTDKTALKKAYAELYIANLVQMYGVSGISEKEFFTQTNKALYDHYGERINTVLLKSWTEDTLKMFASLQVAEYKTKQEMLKAAFVRLDTMEKDSRQEPLL